MNRVKEFRIARGWSQMTLAKEIDVARQTINLIENNKYNPSLDLCIKLAKVLQTDLNALFWEMEELNPKDIKENDNEKNR
ncbi:helix-turn-helix transcriptional regulator [Aerococcaceae bacterium NML160702]|nr:helix-turn-helix transcriptional regulator [Aerococcaceae bacterium NML171108]MCW6680918.1 helix-turn-helix transcriptional regulator [Aerococcaceae bacterium NML130460]MCW6682731.1 helix-turn-helix transcriptional regulator [Aerococcaceae bacterium NML160702]